MCIVQGTSADSMTEYMFLFLMLLALKNIKTPEVMARFQMVLENHFRTYKANSVDPRNKKVKVYQTNGLVSQ